MAYIETRCNAPAPFWRWLHVQPTPGPPPVEWAQQAARARVAAAHRSQRDMADVSLDQTLSSATGSGLTVEAAAPSDSRGSGRAGQLSVLKLVAAMRCPGSRSESRDMRRRRARSLTREVLALTAPAPLVHQYDGWRQGYVSDPEVAHRSDEEQGGKPGGHRSTSGAILALLGSGDGFRDPSDDWGEHRGFVLRSAPGGVLQGWSCPGGAAPFQRDGDASGVAPDGRLTPVSRHEVRLLDSEASVASGRSGQSPGPAQGRDGSKKTQALPSSTMSRATPDYSRPTATARFVRVTQSQLVWACNGAFAMVCISWGLLLCVQYRVQQ